MYFIMSYIWNLNKQQKIPKFKFHDQLEYGWLLGNTYSSSSCGLSGDIRLLWAFVIIKLVDRLSYFWLIGCHSLL